MLAELEVAKKFGFRCEVDIKVTCIHITVCWFLYILIQNSKPLVYISLLQLYT
jgi:hypothetical protein